MTRMHLVLVLTFGMLTASSALLQEGGESGVGVDQAVERRLARRNAFAARMESWEREAAASARPLRAIVASIQEYCEALYPDHLENIEMAEDGPTLEMRLAQNLIRSFERGTTRIPFEEADALVARLRREMTSWR